MGIMCLKLLVKFLFVLFTFFHYSSCVYVGNCKTDRYLFKCLNSSECIPRMKLCDWNKDCSDGSDEANCLDFSLSSLYGNYEHFRCDKGRILSAAAFCNRVDDCGPNDDSDERYCTCNSHEFKCKHTGLHCVPQGVLCDGRDDCGDGSDENPRICYLRKCNFNEFKCGNGRCIPWNKICDHINDCEDKSDENTITSPGFTCYRPDKTASWNEFNFHPFFGYKEKLKTIKATPSTTPMSTITTTKATPKTTTIPTTTTKSTTMQTIETTTPAPAMPRMTTTTPATTTPTAETRRTTTMKKTTSKARTISTSPSTIPKTAEQPIEALPVAATNAKDKVGFNIFIAGVVVLSCVICVTVGFILTKVYRKVKRGEVSMPFTRPVSGAMILLNNERI